jgi:hypothetical protein
MDQNLRDLIAIRQLEATQKLVEQAQQRQIGRLKCPFCGGGVEKNYEKCKNCAANLSWVKGLPCKPGEEENFTQQVEIQAKIFEEEKTKRYQSNLEWNKRYAWFSMIVGVVVAAAAIGYIDATPLGALVLGGFTALLIRFVGREKWHG